MATNGGKEFEQLIKQAAEEQAIDFNRMRDAGYTGERDNLAHKRFTIKNICDCTLFDGRALIYAEIKERMASMTFKSLTQLDDIAKKWKPPINTYSGIIIRFSDTDEIFFIATPRIYSMQSAIMKASFNAKDARAFGKPIAVFIPPRKRTARPDLSSIWIECAARRSSQLPIAPVDAGSSAGMLI